MVSEDLAKEIMKDNFIGIDELSKMEAFKLGIPDMIPEIPFSEKELMNRSGDYYLIFGVGVFDDGSPVTIRNMVKRFGKNPEEHEPCFYNQDWYEKEDFIDLKLEDRWFLIRKDVFEDSRAVQPESLIKKYSFPSAIMCCYSFFVAWLCRDIKLWYHDYVWCNDIDHNGDRIYVGKYHDVDGVNKNGFSIHRYLGLRDCYGCID